ncbi:MAG: hypothetical protein ABI823_10065 [Bryobacteraceae bacterium]
MKTCPHLAGLEAELIAKGIEVEDGRDSPYGPDWGLWSGVTCVFDEPSLRRRLAIPKCVEYTEYDGRVAGSDATFYCKECKRAIMGIHPHYANASIPRVS